MRKLEIIFSPCSMLVNGQAPSQTIPVAEIRTIYRKVMVWTPREALGFLPRSPEPLST